MAKLRQNEIIRVPVVKNMLPEAAAEKEILTTQGITSVLVFPVKIKAELAGFIGLDDVVGMAPWTEEDISTLRTGVEIISNALERYQADQRIRMLFEEEKQQRQELEKEILARANFISILTHELKTPLTPLLSSIELLHDQLDRGQDTIETRLIDNAFNGVNTLNDRLEELLDLAKLTNGTARFNIQPVETGEFLEALVFRLRPVLQKKKRLLVTDIEQPLPVIPFDSEKLEKAIVFLLNNACKASKEEDPIMLRAGVEDNELRIDIEDNGLCLTEEEQDRLFEPYHRVEQDRHHYSGMGLSLAITEQIIKAHGGRIQIQSKKEKGNLFRIGIPKDRKLSNSRSSIQG
jgi:K+-sensing histidine kinase KdpD